MVPLAILLLASLAPPAGALPIQAEVVGCVAGACTVEPIGGPVDVDPLGFTLEVEWQTILSLTENPPGGHWLMTILFEQTGTHTGQENMGQVVLLDPLLNPVGALNVQFDDLNPLERANYEVFGPLNQPFFVNGFTLGLSDGSGVDTMRWVNARFSPAELVPVPEPSMLLLVAAGGLLLGRRRWSRR